MAARTRNDRGVLYDGATLLGTAGAIRGALPKLGKSFFVMYGDSYLTCDYAAVEHGAEFLKCAQAGVDDGIPAITDNGIREQRRVRRRTHSDLQQEK